MKWGLKGMIISYDYPINLLHLGASVIMGTRRDTTAPLPANEVSVTPY